MLYILPRDIVRPIMILEVENLIRGMNMPLNITSPIVEARGGHLWFEITNLFVNIF